LISTIRAISLYAGRISLNAGQISFNAGTHSVVNQLEEKPKGLAE